MVMELKLKIGLSTDAPAKVYRAFGVCSRHCGGIRVLGDAYAVIPVRGSLDHFVETKSRQVRQGFWPQARSLNRNAFGDNTVHRR